MQNVIKICHIISAFYRHDTRIFWKQCRSLVKEGYDVTLIVNDNGVFEIKEGIKIVPSGFNNSSRLKRVLFSRRINFKKALEINADIYQIHDPEFIPLGLRLKKKGKSVIFDSHEDFPRQILEKEWIPKIFRKILSKIAEAYYNYALKKFEAIITVTPHIALALKKTAGNVYVVTNYPIIENDFIPFSLDEYSERGDKLCYAGTVYRSSLQENVFQAILDEDTVDYIIVGIIDEKYKTELSKKNYFSRVQFIDHIPRELLNEIYRKVSIGVAIFDYSPNLGYRTGSLGVNKIFEYMYFGLPIICTDFLLWKEIIKSHNCGICVNPNSIDEIRNAIKYLIGNKKDAYLMGQNGRCAVLEEFNWKSQEIIYIKIMKDILLRMRFINEVS
jgi:glycosyltransferase involved in cell wall biosynthesis